MNKSCRTVDGYYINNSVDQYITVILYGAYTESICMYMEHKTLGMGKGRWWWLVDRESVVTEGMR